MNAGQPAVQHFRPETIPQLNSVVTQIETDSRVKVMKDRSGAAMINVASISGWSPQLAMSGQYGAAKAALIFDTWRWALEFVPYGIRVNTVSPGSILVEGNDWDRYRLANPAYFDDYVGHGFPMGRALTGSMRNISVDGLEQPHAPLRPPAVVGLVARAGTEPVEWPRSAEGFGWCKRGKAWRRGDD